MLADLRDALATRGLAVEHAVPDPVILKHRATGVTLQISLQPFDASKATFIVAETSAPVTICQGYLGSDPRGFPLVLPSRAVPEWFSLQHEAYARAQGLHGAQVVRVDRLFHAPECARANEWAWQPEPFQNAWHIFDRALADSIATAQPPPPAAYRMEEAPKKKRGKNAKK